MGCIKIICHLSQGFSSESHFLFADKMEKWKNPALQSQWSRKPTCISFWRVCPCGGFISTSIFTSVASHVPCPLFPSAIRRLQDRGDEKQLQKTKHTRCHAAHSDSCSLNSEWLERHLNQQENDPPTDRIKQFNSKTALDFHSGAQTGRQHAVLFFWGDNSLQNGRQLKYKLCPGTQVRLAHVCRTPAGRQISTYNATLYLYRQQACWHERKRSPCWRGIYLSHY